MQRCQVFLFAAYLLTASLTLTSPASLTQAAPETQPSDTSPLAKSPGSALACAVAAGPCRWGRTFGGAAEDRAYGLVHLPDGGWLLAGNSREGPGLSFDAWLLRLDQRGRSLWERRFGGPDTDQVFAAAPTRDGGVVLAGHTRSQGAGESDLWLFRLDARGNLLWERVLGGGANERARSIIAAREGGFLVSGFTASQGAGDRDAWILRLDAAGQLLWEQVLGGSGDDGAFHASPHPEGGFAVVGYRSSDAGYDLWVLRLDEAGDKLWSRSFDRSVFEAATAVAALPDGGLVVAGVTGIPDSLQDNVWLAGLDREGTVRWERVLGGPARDNAWAITPRAAGGVIVAAATSSQGAGSADAWLIAVDALGDIVWERVVGGPKWDKPLALSRGVDGGLVIAGTTTTNGAGYEDYWVFELAIPDTK